MKNVHISHDKIVKFFRSKVISESISDGQRSLYVKVLAELIGNKLENDELQIKYFNILVEDLINFKITSECI